MCCSEWPHPDQTLGGLNRARKILADPLYPGRNLLNLLPSGRRFRSISSRTNRLRDTLYPWEIRPLNAWAPFSLAFEMLLLQCGISTCLFIILHYLYYLTFLLFLHYGKEAQNNFLEAAFATTIKDIWFDLKMCRSGSTVEQLFPFAKKKKKGVCVYKYICSGLWKFLQRTGVW